MVAEAALDLAVAAVVLRDRLLEQRHPQLGEAVGVRADRAARAQPLGLLLRLVVVVVALLRAGLVPDREEVVDDDRLPLAVAVDVDGVRADRRVVRLGAVAADVAHEEPLDLRVDAALREVTRGDER